MIHLTVLIHEADHSHGPFTLSVRPSVRKLQNQAKITAGRDCGLAEWIIDDSCLVVVIVNCQFDFLRPDGRTDPVI